MLSTEWLQYYREVSQTLLTVVDVETTGSLAHSSRVTEISVLQATLSAGIVHQTTTLVNPEVAIPPNIVRITGITQTMVDQAPPIAEAWPTFLPLLTEGTLTAHNLAFDYAFLQAECKRAGLTFYRPKHQQLCTVQLARLMLPDLPSRSLPDLVRHFQFAVGRSHRAEADTQACWLLARHLLTELLTEPDAVLLARFAKQRIPLKEAASLLGCSQKQARSQLETAGVPARAVGQGRNSTLIYRRGDVERVVAALQAESQPSLW